MPIYNSTLEYAKARAILPDLPQLPLSDLPLEEVLPYLQKLDRAIVDLYQSLTRVDSIDFEDTQAAPTDTGQVQRNGTYPYYFNGTAAIPMVRHVGARVYNSALQTIANDTITAITFDSERYDTDAFHSTISNTDRLTAPFAGVYLITGTARFAANATGYRQWSLRHGGTTYLAIHTIDADAVDVTAADVSITTLYAAAAGEYFQFAVYQNSGGDLDIAQGTNWSPEFAIAYLGPTA